MTLLNWIKLKNLTKKNCQRVYYQSKLEQKIITLIQKKILKICNNKPVSLEVFADEYKEMKIQSMKINTWGKNVYVKVPVANSKGKFMSQIIK